MRTFKLVKTGFLLCIVFCINSYYTQAQGIQFSAAQKIGTYNHFNVVGASSQGVLVHQFGKTGHIIELYNNNMALLWRKPFPLPEHDIDVVDIDEYNDTLRVVYTCILNDKQYMKFQMFDNNLLALHSKPIVLDSFKSGFTESNSVNVSYHIFRKFALIYYDMHDFSDNRNIPYLILNNYGDIIEHKTVQTNLDFKSPSISEAYVYDKNGIAGACFVYGEYVYKSAKNDYPFSKYGITYSTDGIKHFVLNENEFALSSGDYKWDYVQNRLVICGLYANEPGNAALGCFFSAIDPEAGVVIKKFSSLTHETDIQVNGDANHKKTPEVINFKVRSITLRNDGGCLLVCEQIYQTTETFRNTSYSFYGVSSPTTLNFYHYDDILIVSFGADGNQQWTKVLHKKQESEGDGGYYLSYSENIGEKKMFFLFNDGSFSNASFTGYTLGPEGNVERHELFNNERKSVMMIPQFGKQVNYNEMVVPSIRKNMLQFVKFVL